MQDSQQPSRPGSKGRGSTSSASSRGYLIGLVAIAVFLGAAIGRFIIGPDSGNTDDADLVAALERHLDDNPDDVAAWHQLGTVHLEAAIAADDTTEYTAARDAFERAEELVPRHHTSQRGLAIVAMGLHQFELARDFAQTAHDARPYDPVALAALIDAAAEMGNYDTAVERLDQLLAIRPDAAALSRTSYLRELLGDGQGALDAMLQAEVAIEAGKPEERAGIDVLVGHVYAAQGQLDRAEEAYQDALSVKPDLTDAVVGRARVLAMSGQVDDAIDVLESSPQAAGTELGRMLLIEFYKLVGRDADAAAINAELDEFVDDELARGFGLDPAVVLHASTWGDPDRGLKLARMLDEARPDSVLTADALAWALLQAGDVDEAREVVDRAVRLDTHDAALQYRAAEVFAAAGDEDRARRHLERSRSINPHFSAGLAPAVRDLAEQLGINSP